MLKNTVFGTHFFVHRTVGRVAAVLLAVALVAAACGSDDNDPAVTGAPGTETPATGTPVVIDDIQLVVALETFNSCDALLEHLRAEALERVGPYGLPRSGDFYPVEDDFVIAETAADDGAQNAESTSSTGGDFSDTNVQVVGVDEPDIVKTDGDRILATTGGVLHYIQLDPDTGRGQIRGQLDLGVEWAAYEMIISGDKALVFSQSEGHIEPFADTSEGDPIFEVGTLIREVDLSNPAAMRVAATLEVEGRYLSARSVGDTVWASVVGFPNFDGFVRPGGPDSEEIALRTNRQIVEEATLDFWLPDVRFTGPAGSEEGQLADCDRVYAPSKFSGFTSLSVLTFNLAEPLDTGEAVSVLADGETLYGSGSALYLASSSWGNADGTPLDPSQMTIDIHKFSVSTEGPANYEASGSVPGRLINQFAMDEYDGHLRVATTIPAEFRSEPDAEDAAPSESRVTVLRQQDRQLVVVGQVDGLGVTEQIFAVRFIREQGYVVTFRQIDPLYVLDLSDPANPAVAGELKIPGFSTYLHPVDDGLLLGVGEDADADGRTLGVKVSLFDVSDPTSPREVDTWTLADSLSPLLWEHRAFLYWAPERLAFVPVEQYDTGFAGVVVFRVDAQGELEEVGRVSHDSEEDSSDSGVPEGCRRLSVEEAREQFDVIADVLVQICQGSVPGGISGYSCSQPAPNLPGSEALAEDEFAEICWPAQRFMPINRSLVNGDRLWTLTNLTVQANDLDTLDFLQQLELKARN